MANLTLQNVVLSIVAVAVGLILIGSLLAPIASDIMVELAATVGDKPVYEDGAVWSSLVGVTVIISILGLVITAINNYLK
jgi:hypothetical protein